jgi:hypothetical protein
MRGSLLVSMARLSFIVRAELALPGITAPMEARCPSATVRSRMKGVMSEKDYALSEKDYCQKGAMPRRDSFLKG